MRVLICLLALWVTCGAYATEDVRITSSESEFLFGLSVDVLHDRVACAGQTTTEPGAIYVLRRDEFGEWTEEQRLVASDGDTADRLGADIALGSGFLVASADRWDGPGLFESTAGAVYIYTYDDDLNSWEETQRLDRIGSLGGTFFGSSVATDGTKIVIGRQGGGPDGGDAFVYRFSDTSSDWVEEQRITGSGTVLGDSFGTSVQIDGDWLAVTSGLNLISDDGVVYMFRWDPLDLEWTEEQILEPSDTGTEFGTHLAFADGLLVVGAERDSTEATEAGAVHVFRYDELEEEWVEEATLTASNATADARFGRSVATDGSSFVVGAFQGTGENENSGAAYVFKEDASGEWVEVEILAASDGEDGDEFGLWVGVDSDVVACNGFSIGLTPPIGAVYVFDPSIRPFLRGDCDGNGSILALADALYLLQWQFTFGPEPPCMDAADVDDNGEVVGLVDALALLQWGFLGGGASRQCCQ